MEDGYGGGGFEGPVVEVFRCGSSGEVEVGEKCGFGWTAPRERSWAAKAGSSASRFMAGRFEISADVGVRLRGEKDKEGLLDWKNG